MRLGYGTSRERRRFLWFSGVALACATACDGGCGCQDDKPTPAASAQSPSAAGVEIVNAGQAPRSRLEMGRWAGLVYEVTVRVDGSFGVTGQPPAKAPSSVTRMEFEVIHGSADPVTKQFNGVERTVIEERGEILDVKLESEEVPAPTLALLNDAAKVLRGIVTRQYLGEDGRVVDTSTEQVAGKPPTPEVKKLLDEGLAAQRYFPFRLPHEPVGQGAKWKFSEQVELRGVRAQQAAELDLTKLTESSATISVRVRQQAPRQEIPHPLDPNNTATVEQFRSDGTGEIVVDRLTGIVTSAHLATSGSLRLSAQAPTGERQETTFMAASVIRTTGRVIDEDAGRAARATDAGENEAGAPDAANDAPFADAP